VKNPDFKTSRTALAAVVSFVIVTAANRLGLELPADVRDGLVFLILAYGLHQSRDGVRARTSPPKGGPSAGRVVTGLIALFVCTAVVLTSVGCGVKPPSRETLERIAAAGRTIENEIEVNRTLPDQLFGINRLTMIDRLQLDDAIEEARAAVSEFNAAMTEVLKSDKPQLQPLFPVALKLVRRIHVLDRVDIPDWNKAFAAAQVALTFVANYFAIKVSEFRALGLSDRQIAKLSGVTYDPRDFELLENYRVRAASATVGSE
jgi:hypothetical protein